MGTATILCTDVEPSRARPIVDRFAGRIAMTHAEHVVAVFDAAFDGARAAITLAQEADREHRSDAGTVAPRIGINVGEMIDDPAGEDPFAVAVALARRLCAAAQPGRIMVAAIVEMLLRRRVELGFVEVTDRVEPDLASDGPIFELRWDPLPDRPAARVVVADDAGFLRAGVVKLLASTGFDVVAEAADFDGVLAAVEEHRPDLLITDIRMPPTNTDEGIRAAVELRQRQPGLAVLVLSQYVDATAAIALLDSADAGVGYLLKERVSEVGEFVDAALDVLAGGIVVDPTVSQRTMARRSMSDALARLSGRERDVLAQMATGASNASIAETLSVSTKTIETHVSAILTKLDLPDAPEGNRRVQAVLRFLEATR